MIGEYQLPSSMLKSKGDVDGGWAWAVLGGSFMNLLICSGLANVSGMFQKLFLEEFRESVALTAWSTSLFSSSMQLAGPLSGILVSAINCRASAMLGGTLLALGLAASSFANSIYVLLVTFGLCGGTGLGLLYTPSIVVVNYFFDRRRTAVTGLALSAGGIGIIAAPVLLRYLLDYFTWQEALLVLACLSAQTCIFGALMFPIHEQTSRCVQLYQRCMKRHRQNNSDLIQIQCKEVCEIAVSDQCKEENEDEMRNEESLQRQHGKVTLNLKSLPCSSVLEHENIAIHLQDEHIKVIDGSVLESVVLSDEEVKMAESTPLMQTPALDSNCSDYVVSGKLKSKDHGSPMLTTVNLSHHSKISKSRKSPTEALLHEEAPANVLTKADCQTVSTFPKNHNLEDVGLQSTILDGTKTDMNISPQSSKNRESNLVVFNFSFIMLCVNLFLSNAACGILFIHLPAFCAQRGIDDQAVAFIFAMNGAGIFLSRILLGALGNDDNVDQLAVYFGLHAISAFILTMLSFANSVTSVTAMIVLMGIYYGSIYSLLSSLTIALVGLQRLAFAFGVEMISAGSGYLVAPPLAGWIVDETENYNNSKYLGGFLLFLSAIAVLFMTCGQKPRASVANSTPSVEEDCSKF